MSAIEIVITKLLADAGVTALVGQRVRPMQGAQGDVAPFIVVNQASEGEQPMLRYDSGYYESRVSIELNSTTGTGVTILGTAIKLALKNTVKEAVGAYLDVDILKSASDYTDVNDARTLVRRIMDYTVHWR